MFLSSLNLFHFFKTFFAQQQQLHKFELKKNKNKIKNKQYKQVETWKLDIEHPKLFRHCYTHERIFPIKKHYNLL